MDDALCITAHLAVFLIFCWLFWVAVFVAVMSFLECPVRVKGPGLEYLLCEALTACEGSTILYILCDHKEVLTSEIGAWASFKAGVIFETVPRTMSEDRKIGLIFI